jgi:uncharacterized protein
MPDHNVGKSNLIDACFVRWVFIAFGWLSVGLGIIGVFVPGLPTTVFMLIALWAFSKSSEKFQAWLWHHPRFGRSIQNWHCHRVISRRAKVFAVLSMTASFSYIIFISETWLLPGAMAGIMVPVALYLVTRESTSQEKAAPET